MRLFSAIPLLFWFGTAAVAQLAQVWALVPAAVTPVAHAAETALGSDSDAAIHSAGQFVPGPVTDVLQPWPARAADTVVPEVGPPASDSTPLRHQLLSAARLSGNPPPQRA